MSTQQQHHYQYNFDCPAYHRVIPKQSHDGAEAAGRGQMRSCYIPAPPDGTIFLGAPALWQFKAPYKGCPGWVYNLNTGIWEAIWCEGSQLSRNYAFHRKFVDMSAYNAHQRLYMYPIQNTSLFKVEDRVHDTTTTLYEEAGIKTFKHKIWSNRLQSVVSIESRNLAKACPGAEVYVVDTIDNDPLGPPPANHKLYFNEFKEMYTGQQDNRATG